MRIDVINAVFAACAALAMSACTRDETPAPQPAAASTPEPAARAPATNTTTGVAGTYGGILPCADCAGIDTRLRLDADGSYSLTQVYQDRDHASLVSDGTWALTADGAAIELSPADKDEFGTSYGLLPDGSLRMRDRDGKEIDSALDYTLKRR